ncbi:hypothetical protein [Streptomyces melanogenes]|uniref:hypothetical protein n=1 Tax=Streptomyces melanogenes TaxID=67326 RepID=UPI00379828AA
MRICRRKAAGAVLTAAMATAFMAGTAFANDANVSPAQCYSNNTFKFRLFYNSGQKGAWERFGYSEQNFGAYDGSPGHLIFHYCPGTGPGSGEQ